MFQGRPLTTDREGLLHNLSPDCFASVFKRHRLGRADAVLHISYTTEYKDSGYYNTHTTNCSQHNPDKAIPCPTQGYYLYSSHRKTSFQNCRKINIKVSIHKITCSYLVFIRVYFIHTYMINVLQCCCC